MPRMPLVTSRKTLDKGRKTAPKNSFKKSKNFRKKVLTKEDSDGIIGKLSDERRFAGRTVKYCTL